MTTYTDKEMIQIRQTKRCPKCQAEVLLTTEEESLFGNSQRSQLPALVFITAECLGCHASGRIPR